MESVVDNDSPLAHVLLEGNGLAESNEQSSMQPIDHMPPSNAHFAPDQKGFTERLRQRLGQPLKITIPHDGPVSQLQTAFSEVISTSLGTAENERFLEQFRYVLVASNLLNEQSNRASFRPTLDHKYSGHSDSQPTHWSVEGAAVVVAFPAIIAWSIRWTLARESGGFSVGRLAVVFLFTLLAFGVARSHITRQRLQSLRERAVKTANAAVTNLQALDQSSSAALTLVREVELVSRGYRLTGHALPPVSRLDESRPGSQSRRCLRLRRLLCRQQLEIIPSMMEACQTLEPHVFQDDLEKYLDIHEIAVPDVQEAFTGAQISEIDDQESLSALRSMQWRFGTLRKVLICNLLALPARGNAKDIVSWKTAIDVMNYIAKKAGDCSEKLNDILREDEQINQTPTTPTNRNTPEKERFRMQLRKANELSSELRAMGAKLHILRDDVSRILEGEGNINAIPPLFNMQADTIGHDLKMLNQTYESWRASLLPPIDRADRRRSRPSSELRSPISLGGLTVVDELNALDGPSEALRALNGESSGSGCSPIGSNSDEEVFEAVGLPRIRRSMTREEKIAKLQDEESRRAIAREQRLATNNMVRELETVINTRFTNRMSTGRIPPNYNSRISSI